jgi:hypothetical protein
MYASELDVGTCLRTLLENKERGTKVALATVGGR